MDTQGLACDDAVATSHLLIHTADDGGSDGRRLNALIRRLRARLPAGRHSEGSALALEIHDLQGRRLLVIHDARPVVDVALPPGTYRVCTAIVGNRRSYTLVLPQGATVELHLCTARVQH
jgi:predicted RNA polymerase sigma factor